MREIPVELPRGQTNDNHSSGAYVYRRTATATVDFVALKPRPQPGLLNLKTEDTFQTLATRDSFGPTGARLMSTHPLAG